jgi:1-pyrroline-5-carboxylate dehydrogenase
MLAEFRNEPYTDFSKPENRKAQEEALRMVEQEFSREYGLLIDGKEVKTGRTLKSYNPSQKDQVVGTFHKAGKAEVDLAMSAALQAQEHWKRIPAQERAVVLAKAAQILRRRKSEVNAWMIFEAGKTWLEAEADMAEAIDFLDFYAREAIRWSETKGTIPFPNEFPELCYVPLGVGAIIPPWNFPMAILTGMAGAAIVSGNAVLVKPASDTPCIGYQFVKIMQEAGLPPGVLNYIPGSGGEMGDYLVGHPKTRFISFTGSKEVGLHINELAAKLAPGQIWVKRVVAEMGGKDSMVIDSDTDLNEAAAAVVFSAFGYQGQKCSACSRAIIVKEVYDQVLELVVAKTKTLSVGPAKDPNMYMGPVINSASETKILEYIEIGKKEGRLVAGGAKASGDGYFIQPTVIADIQPGSRLDQEEIFGPVLAVLKAQNYDEALAMANATEFGLTGAVWTRDRYKIVKAKNEFHVGNLYINRKCTGAMVGAHPFGGFNMSGTDSKAGGRDYLGLFMQAKSISERLI